MRYLPILALFGLLHAQDYWVRWNGELTIPDQREFAGRCYEIGEETIGGRGHTLAGLAFMESSLGAIKKHNEESYGYFGVSFRSAVRYRGLGLATLLREGNVSLEDQAFLAVEIFNDNVAYFRRLGYSPGAAWWHSAARYNAGKHWDGEAGQEYARKFNERVAFLKTQFK